MAKAKGQKKAPPRKRDGELENALKNKQYVRRLRDHQRDIVNAIRQLRRLINVADSELVVLGHELARRYDNRIPPDDNASTGTGDGSSLERGEALEPALRF